MAERITTANIFGVGVRVGDGRLYIQSSTVVYPLSKDDALNLAAWLVAMADPTRERFDELLKRVLAT